MVKRLAKSKFFGVYETHRLLGQGLSAENLSLIRDNDSIYTSDNNDDVDDDETDCMHQYINIFLNFGRSKLVYYLHIHYLCLGISTI